MDPKRWEELQQLFEAALALDPEQRGAYLESACSNRADRLEVEALLVAHEGGAGPFLERAVGEAIDSLPPAASEASVGQRLGAYEIEAEIGRGGMGTVYRARRADARFEMRVAIKLVRGGIVSTETARRFLAERQILANLTHSNIARLLDGGETEDGLPYLVMEYVDGEPIDLYCDRHRLTTAQRLNLFLQVCDAVQFAHRNLVVHRDLKPGNILVTADRLPKLLDFGIAKLLDPAPYAGAAIQTATVVAPMTPEYASPEQFRGQPTTTSTDVYALGLLLYELLTGRRPQRVHNARIEEMARIVCDTSPERPSTVVTREPEHEGTAVELAKARSTSARRLRNELRGDLDTIVLMALRKKPERRYPSVERLAEDVRRYQRGLPVLARDDTWVYRAGRFVRRHTTAVVVSAVFVLALTAASVISTMLYLRAERAQREVAEERHTAEQIGGFLESVLASVDPRIAQGRDVTLLREVLDETADRIQSEFPADSEVAARLLVAVGRSYASIAAYDAAERHLRAAIAIRTDRSTVDAAAVAGAQHELGALLYTTSEFAEAKETLEAALTTRRRLANEAPKPLIDTVSQFALVHEALGEREKAEPLHREALAMAESVYGPTSPEYAQLLRSLGSFLLNHERRDEAEPMLDHAVEVFRAAESPDLLDFANALHDAAVAKRDRGGYDAAVPIFEEALEIKRRILDADHPEIGVTLNNLAGLYEFRGDFARAEPLYLEALRIQKANLDPDHRDVGTTQNNIAGLYRKLGRFEESERFFLEALRVYRTALGNDHAWVAIVLLNMATLYEAMGDCAKNEPVLREYERIASGIWAQDHWRLAVATSIGGACLARQGRFDEAESRLEQAHAAIVRALGEDHWQAKDSARRLIELYDRLDKQELAAPYRELVR